MQPFKWNKKHEVFVPELDAEHRNIFRAAEELRAASAGDPERVRVLLSELVAGAEEHFRHEERLMRASGYPSWEWHKQQHDTVRKRLKTFAGQIEAGDPDALTALLDFLAIWLKEHTSLSDRMMSAYLRNYRRLHATAAS
jgi:hemerythrin